MVAKINSGSSLYGAVMYNQEKVDNGTAKIIGGNKMITDLSDNTDSIFWQTLLSFEDYLLANKRTEKPVIHISLNPTTEDKLTNKEFTSLAKDFMEKMNLGNQPYIVYLHEDIDRRHIHIVSVRIDETGKKINDSFEHRRSMDACRELELKYGLKTVSDNKRDLNAGYLKKVDYKKGDVKRQVSNTLKSVLSSYKFQSFGEYSALLSCYNIEAKLMKGEKCGKTYNGIVYSATDDKGKVLGNPFKSSLFGKAFGYEGLNKRMKKTTDAFKAGKFSPQIKDDILTSIKSCRSKEMFVDLLKMKGIDVVFRENKAGRIYGVTFIDHNRKEVYNGSRLGKEFSANVMNNLFNNLTENRQNIKQESRDFMPEKNNSLNDSPPAFIPDNDTPLEQVFGILNFEQHGTDWQEEAFGNRMRRKKKKKSKRPGLQ